MNNEIAKISGSTPENEAATCVAATGEKTTVANALKEEREAESGRKNPNAPLTPGRLAYESVWHQQMQPQRWDHLRPVGDVPKGYVNPIPWIGVVKPVDWDRMKDNPDSVDGKPPVPVNEMRIRHPSAVFMAPRRLQMYEDVVFAAAEPQYLVLWAINIVGERWLDAEGLMAEDSYWWGVYREEFGLSDEGDTEAIGITSYDGTGNRSGNEVTHVEA